MQAKSKGLLLNVGKYFLIVITGVGLSSRLVAAERLRGDLNGDGSVDISDLTRLVEVLAREDRAGLCAEVADVNGDEELDYSDLIYLSRFLFNDGDIPVPFPHNAMPCEEAPSPPAVGAQALVATVLSPSSVMITWETAARYSTVVRFGLTLHELDQTVEIPERVRYHQALLTGLEPGTTYYYAIGGEGGAGGEAREPLSFQTLQDIRVEIRPARPRLLMTADTVAELKKSIRRQPQAELWAALLRYCDLKLGADAAALTVSDDAGRVTRAFAFASVLSGKDAYGEKAIALATHLARSSEAVLRARVEGMAYVYDWMHDELSVETRDLLRSTLMAESRRLRSRNDQDGFVAGHNHGNHKSALLGFLALHGDEPRADAEIQEAVRSYRYGFLASWRRFASADGGSWKGWWYTSFALPFSLEFLAAWRSATGEDLFLVERDWCEKMLEWFAYGLRGDRTFLREGDGKVFNGVNFQDRHFGRLMAKEYGSSLGQWLAEVAAQATPPWGYHTVLDLLWSDFDVEARAPVGPGARRFRNAGVVIMRNGWSKDAVLASFRSAETYTLGHSHRDNCSFSIFYKGALALDSGIYDDYGTSHYWNYYTRTAAHNTMTVLDPGETFKIYGKEYANDGGQRWLLEGEDVPNTWPETPEHTVDESAGYRLGGILRHEDTGDYTYSLGNGGPSYHPAKVTRFFRHFLWLKDVRGWSLPVALVFDDVVSSKASFRKTYHLHLRNQPAIEGRRVTAANGMGKLFQITVAPEDARIEAVGGPGSEYLVNGVNYPPVRSPQTREDGGKWRVEVSPREPSREDRFLHALFPADPDASEPPEVSAFVWGSMHVCELGQWTILFDFGTLPEILQYPHRRAQTQHLVFGAVPGGSYRVRLDGEVVSEPRASFAGTLQYAVGAAGNVTVERLEDT